jgi:hypothetical protein
MTTAVAGYMRHVLCWGGYSRSLPMPSGAIEANITTGYDRT